MVELKAAVVYYLLMILDECIGQPLQGNQFWIRMSDLLKLLLDDLKNGVNHIQKSINEHAAEAHVDFVFGSILAFAAHVTF